MAFRAMGHWKWMVTPMGRSPSRFFASSTTATAAHNHPPKNKYEMSMDHAPIYILAGMLVMAMGIATHTAKQNLMHAPGVVISKKKRESISEADNPDQAFASANKFVDKSFLRKVGHIQDNDNRTLPFPRADPFAKRRTAESLKSVGIDPSRH